MLRSFLVKKEELNIELMNVSDFETSPLEELEELVKKTPQAPNPTIPSGKITMTSPWRLVRTLRPYIPSPRGLTQALKAYMNPSKAPSSGGLNHGMNMDSVKPAINALPREGLEQKMNIESGKSEICTPSRGGFKRKIVIDSAKALLK